jgi:hypothetical protein
MLLGYRQDNREISFRFLVGEGDISLLHSVQTGSGDHHAPYVMSIGNIFPRDKGPGVEFYLQSYLTLRLRNVSDTSIPQSVSMGCCLCN